MESSFTEAEKKYIHFPGLLMTYMKALEYLSAYLSSFPSGPLDYREQDYDRALNQVTVLESLELFLQERYSFRL